MPCHARATALSFYPPAMPVQCHARGAKRAGPPPSSVPCSAATRTVGRSAGCCGDEHTSNSRSISKLDSWALLCHRGREDFENSLTHPHDVHYYSGGRAPSNAPRTAHSVAAVKEGGKEGEGEGASTEGHRQAALLASTAVAHIHGCASGRVGGREFRPLRASVPPEALSNSLV